MKKKIYLSGPLNDRPRPETFEQFGKAEQFLTYLGFEVINPVNASGFRETVPGGLLPGADALFALVGWQDDPTACIEYKMAERQGCAILHEMNVLRLGQGFIAGVSNKRVW